MHDALLITEVRSSILDFLVVDTAPHPRKPHPKHDLMPKDTRRAGRRALSALARTCRALSEPALDALWRRLHSLEPLLRCVRAKAISVVEVEPETLAPFHEEEWDIVLRYALRVQELTVSDVDTLSIKILQALWFHTTVLLPNLRKLCWSHNDITQFATIRLLLSPSLVDLSVWLDDGDHTSILAFLERYPTISPNIKSLRFSHLFQNSSPLAVAAISRAISRSPDLEVLNCHEIDGDAIFHLIQSPRLKEFSARLRHHRPDDFRRLARFSIPDCPPFRNLRVLNLYLEDISSITPCLHSTHQPFEEVSLEFFLITPKGLHEFFSALNSTTRQQTLRRIKLVDSGPGGIDPIQQLDFELLKPLLAFSLRRLDVDLRINPISLNDDELLQLVKAWPELEVFNLNQHNLWIPSRLPSLRSLLLMVARCPKLHTLGLCVDARTIPFLTAEELAIRNVLIKKLELGYSPIASPVVAGVAQFLLDHFPSLSGLSSRFPYSVDRRIQLYATMWREVSIQIEEARGENAPGESSDSDSEMYIDGP
ncbi:hypothetical protein JVU11DRAFT_99 [Chiua virens]|nr:hypothetical protein JVU11DRAFT_99 [Chiua virens]